MEFVVPGGMRDEFLVAGMHDRPPAQVFPLNDKGRPLFRPSATWYIAQVDCRNALSWRVVDAKVMPRDEDIVMAIRVEGVFTEVYEVRTLCARCCSCSCFERPSSLLLLTTSITLVPMGAAFESLFSPRHHIMNNHLVHSARCCVCVCVFVLCCSSSTTPSTCRAST